MEFYKKNLQIIKVHELPFPAHIKINADALYLPENEL